MTESAAYTNRCACGWEITGPEDVVIEATLEHARRIHNMTATRDQVLATLHGSPAAPAGAAVGGGAPGGEAAG
jgi:predicted small metal-binding protein